MNFNGYQPPMKPLNPDDLVADEVIPEPRDGVLTGRLGASSLQAMTLSWRGQQLWQNAYADFQAG